MRRMYEVSESAECRVWHRYLTNSYELLNNSAQSLQDAGLYSGQVGTASKSAVMDVVSEDAVMGVVISGYILIVKLYIVLQSSLPIELKYAVSGLD